MAYIEDPLKKYCLTKADLLKALKEHEENCDFLIKKGGVCNCQQKED